MASAEATASASSLGPRYAPDDPTLPKPWKGLIDGTTGVLYFWNPETNVTQYERPASSMPPLPPGPPPSASMLKLAPVSATCTIPSNGPLSQQPGQPTIPQQQLVRNLQQLPQSTVNHQQQQYPQLQMQYSQLSFLHGQLMSQPQVQQQQQRQSSQVAYQQQDSQVPYHQQQEPQMPRMPFQMGQPPQGSQGAHQQGQQPQDSQAAYQQGQVIAAHLQGEQPQRQQIAARQQGQQVAPHQQGQQVVPNQQGHQITAYQQEQQIAAYQQGQLIGFPRTEESGQQEGKQASLLQLQQSNLMPSNNQLPSIATQGQVSQGGVNLIRPQQQQQQFSGLSCGGQQFSVQQAGASPVPLQQTGMETSLRRQQMGSPMSPNRVGQSIARPLEREADRRERVDFYSSSRIEGPLMLLQQPKLSPLSHPRNQQDVRMGIANPPFTSPGHSGGLNMVPGHQMPNVYNHPPFPNAASMRPSPKIFGAPDFTDITEADSYRQHHEVTTMGDNIPAPFVTFGDTGFPPEILREMQLAGFSSPTPIQAQTWPIALQSRDVVAIAKTGSGKTLGYLIPAFIHLRQCHNNPMFGPTVLVLAPTRELATQIQDEAIKFGRSSRVSCTCLYGGAPKGPQLKEIERGADIIVATPGRLNDILEMKKINFRQVSLLVLDEADRMLDMGFEPQIRKIVNEIPPRRQTLMYTATWPKDVRKIAGDLLVNPVQVNIGSVDELAANKAITQYVELVPPMEKQRRLEQILRSHERGSKIIVFCSTKRLCDQLARSIGRTFGAISIHGDKSQSERDHALNQFRSGRAPVLVATDVAARGLDIKDIRVVVNYDFPTGIEDYVHRIGRTGRAGATGVSYTFFSDQDWKYAADLIKVLEGANQRVPPEVREMAARGGGPRAFSHEGMSRWESGRGPGSGRLDSGAGRGGGGRWDPDGVRGVRDFGDRGFGGRGGGGRGGMRGRDFGGSDRFSGPGGGGRFDRGPNDRYRHHVDGRGRFDGGGRRGFGDRSRGRSYSRSPERVRTWGYDRSRSRSGSRSWSRSRSRSWSQSRSRSRSGSRSRSQSRSRSRSYDNRYERVPRGIFSGAPPEMAAAGGGRRVTGFDVLPVSVSGFDGTQLAGHMSPMSPGRVNSSFRRNAPPDEPQGTNVGFSAPETGPESRQ